MGGFVGEGSGQAGAYYSKDFEWESVAEEAGMALKKQEDARAVGTSTFELDMSSWEKFHSQHSEARFFKERRYMLLEFPQLKEDYGTDDSTSTSRPQHFVEIGCGAGSSILPVLKANQSCRATVCDISAAAVGHLTEAAERVGIDGDRVNAFPFDASEYSEGHPLQGLQADAVILIFTLSALTSEQMPAMLKIAADALRPGGRLLFRDYGMHDMAMLRFPGQQKVGDNLYHRTDGTLAYFFTLEDIQARAAAAGLVTEECEYACVQLKNRKKGNLMKRVFVHGAFRKP